MARVSVGTGVSPGVAVGIASLLDPGTAPPRERALAAGRTPAAEIEAFAAAREIAREELAGLQARLSASLGASYAAILDAQILLVNDPALVDEAERRIREERVILANERAEVTFSGATWVFPNGGGAGFYRFALDDRAIERLAAALATGLAPEERLNLVGNQWALLKAGIGSVGAFLTLIRGFSGEQDRAVLEAISQRLGWLALIWVASVAALAMMVTALAPRSRISPR